MNIHFLSGYCIGLLNKIVTNITNAISNGKNIFFLKFVTKEIAPINLIIIPIITLIVGKGNLIDLT